MAQDLVVIGRGELIWQGAAAEFVDRFTGREAVVRTPHADLLAGLLQQAGVPRIEQEPDGALLLEGVDLAFVGDLAAAHGIPLHELSRRTASLEDAFLRATGTAAEFRAVPSPATAAGGAW